MAKQKGKIITVTSTKGGVGKTIMALNLAGVYHLLKKKTLIVDFDLYGGSVGLALNVEGEKTIFNLVDDLTNNRYQSFEDYIYHYNENIDILCSPKDPRQAGKIDVKYVTMILSNAEYKYDVILVDTSHNLTPINIVALDYSDQILYVMTNDPMDLKNTKSFMAIMKDSGIDNLKVVLNDSCDTSKNYFTNFDIKNVIKANIDYTISSGFFIPDIDRYIMDGKILLLNKRLSFLDRKDYNKIVAMGKELIDYVEEVK